MPSLSRLLVLMCALTTAGSADARRQGAFERADFDRDHMLTRMEACRGVTPALCRHFDRIDLNGDRQLSRAEVRAWNKRPKGKPRRR